MRKITVVRPKHFACAMVKYSVELDGKPFAKIKNNDTVSIEVDDQKHEMKVCTRGVFDKGDKVFSKMPIPAGDTDYCFQLEIVMEAPMLRPSTGEVLKEVTGLTLTLGSSLSHILLDEKLHAAILTHPETKLVVSLKPEGWYVFVEENGQLAKVVANKYTQYLGAGKISMGGLVQAMDLTGFRSDDLVEKTTTQIADQFLALVPGWEVLGSKKRTIWLKAVSR